MRVLLKTALQNSHYRWLFGIIIIAMILATVASQLEIFAIGLITQKGQTSGNGITQVFDSVDRFLDIQNNLPRLAIFLFIVALFKAVTMFAHRYSTKLAAIQISRELRQKYFEHIQTLPMSFYQKHNMGSLSSRVVNDASVVAEAINACLVNYLETPFIIITTLILCFFTSWQLSLFIFIGFPLIVLPIVYLSKGVKRIAKQIQGIQEKFAAVLIDFIGGIQTIKIFAMENFSLRKYEEQNLKMAALEKRSSRYDLASRPIVHTIAMTFLAVALVWGLYVLHMNVSEVLFFCGMLYLFYEPVKKFAEQNGQIQKGIAAAERMLDVMHLHPEIKDQPGAEAITTFNHEISFEDVWFKYNDEWILKGLSFTIKKGQKVAIVGPTGAGKSTIVQLIPRLYDIQKGSIKIDGKPLSDYTQRSLRELIAFVPQRPFLFMDTIASNISYGKDFTPDEIQQAAKKAHASEFIENLPLKYETQVTEGGKNLSGGQQQRLAIARALVKKAPLLVMDEATSSLDALSEDHIKQALHHLKGEMTQILIAHRLSTIEDADNIIYLDHGRKIAEGTKEELLAECPSFQRVWELLHQSH